MKRAGGRRVGDLEAFGFFDRRTPRKIWRNHKRKRTFTARRVCLSFRRAMGVSCWNLPLTILILWSLARTIPMVSGQPFGVASGHPVTKDPPQSRSRFKGIESRNYFDEPLVNDGSPLYNQSNAFRTWFKSILASYDNRLRPQFGVSPLQIKLGLILISISSVSEGSMEFTVEMFLHESWTDERLIYEPGEVGFRSPLTLPLDAPRTFWTPDTTFLNARRSQGPEMGSVSHLHYMKLHSNGTLQYSRRLSVTAECQMDLTMYPFDQQACSLELSSYGWTVDDVIYEWALTPSSIRLERLMLPDFDPKSYVVTTFNRSYVAGYFSVSRLCIVLKRRSGFCFLQLFVPATAVVGSSWISLWLESETQFADMVAVILAIIFLSYSYNTVMPKVSYIKAMDIYLGACFIFAFISLVKLAIVKYMHKRVTKRKEQRQGAAVSASSSTPLLPPAKLLAVAEEKNGEESVHLLTVDNGAGESTPQGTPVKVVKNNGGGQPQQQAIRRMTMSAGGGSTSHISVNRVAAYHDYYWRCMKAFHVISQLTLPLAFGAFGVFYFFIYPNVQKQATC